MQLGEKRRNVAGIVTGFKGKQILHQRTHWECKRRNKERKDANRIPRELKGKDEGPSYRLLCLRAALMMTTRGTQTKDEDRTGKCGS